MPPLARRSAERALRAARRRRSPVRHPPLLRHPGDDGRRHQPRGGGARLRHAAADRGGGRREPPRGPNPLHLQLRDDRAPPGALGASRTAVRRPLRPGDRDPDHGRRLGGRGPRPARHVRSRRRGHPPRAVATSRTCRRSCSPAARSSRVATRFEDDFALDPATVEAAITPRTKALFLGYPANPTGAVLDDAVQDELARIAVRPRPPRLQRRDLRPARLRHVPPPRFSSLPGCGSGRS